MDNESLSETHRLASLQREQIRNGIIRDVEKANERIAQKFGNNTPANISSSTPVVQENKDQLR